MKSMLSWQKNNTTLILKGILNRDTLMFFWKQKNELLKDINAINVSLLSHVDSAGLAMLVRLKTKKQFKNKLLIEGISENLKTLIILYKLEDFIILF
ncbi:lipid asymmetry maintenance protein MlaB [Arsenophonus symbiont of Ornithomya chloropus]|uniref:lipid asymmetry maintenance protein MlaB n=1 Tax=Arsenophonus symbiont of Ornithomya chloropus TaxID=634121 RepID=UPI0032B107B9